jgi:hypothetical protein
MKWTEKQLLEDNSTDYLEVISRELERQERVNKKFNG